MEKSQGDQTYAWNSPQVVGVLGAAGVLYVLFVIAERFAAEPILPLGLFATRCSRRPRCSRCYN